jgi:hypothetical protein
VLTNVFEFFDRTKGSVFDGAIGVVGLALVERLKLKYSMRHVMAGCVVLVILGNLYCLPWTQRPSVYQVRIHIA